MWCGIAPGVKFRLEVHYGTKKIHKLAKFCSELSRRLKGPYTIN